MGKKAKSQWDFGELFPPEVTQATRKVLTVAELTSRIKRLLEQQVGSVWVTGEVTNLRAQSSGHLYFTLKDADSQLNCVLFRSEARVGRDLLQDGRKVVVGGDLTVYEPRGQYQLRVTTVELQGVGALQAAFEKLKAKLDAEGLFARARKRALPEFPERIGIATSLSGAAIRDVMHVVQRRNPSLELVLAPCRVQGQGAAEEIADAIGLLNTFNARQTRARPGLDLILLTRGGGSLEDLWAFNEEVLARAIFESKLPVVSAVGHEVDFTISDFVADVRAATPSAAAEIITEGVFASSRYLADAGLRMRQLVQRQLEGREYEVEQLRQRLARCGRQGVRDRNLAWRNLRDRLARVRPAQVLAGRREAVEVSTRRLREAVRQQLRNRRQQWSGLDGRLRLLGPEQVLARGYSITMNADTGAVIRAAAEAKSGQKLRTRLKSGEVRSTID
jgi:exodeoxyribonuclease VII large subunit